MGYKNMTNKEYRENHKEQHKESNKNWNKKNPDRMKELKRNFYLKNPNKRKQYFKKYCFDSPEKVLVRSITRYVKIPKNKLCEECNKLKAKNKHHLDYRDPFAIKFVCIKCHNKLDEVNYVSA